MLEQKQSVFLIENLQPDWLPEHECRRTRQLAWLLGGLTIVMVLWIFMGPVGALLFGWIGVLSFRFRLGDRLGEGDRLDVVEPVEALVWSWGRAWKGLANGLLFGLKLGSVCMLGVGIVTWWIGATGVTADAMMLVRLAAWWTNELPTELVPWLVSWLTLGLLGGLAFGLVIGLTVGVVLGLGSEKVHRKSIPNQGIHESVKNAVVSGLFFGLFVGLDIALVWTVFGGRNTGSAFGLMLGSFAGLFGVMTFGGTAAILHFAIRVVLCRTNRAPWNYIRFLDCCVDRIFLRRVGGGYIFIHRLLMEHFASLTPEDIERLAAGVEGGRV